MHEIFYTAKSPITSVFIGLLSDDAKYEVRFPKPCVGGFESPQAHQVKHSERSAFLFGVMAMARQLEMRN